MTRKVTEQDFRKPEFVGKNPNDYEFRSDGEVVRKDRWEQGIQKIRLAVGHNLDEFEIDDIVEAVETLVRTVPLKDDVIKSEQFRRSITYLVIAGARSLDEGFECGVIEDRVEGILVRIDYEVGGCNHELVECLVRIDGDIVLVIDGIRFKE